MINPTPKKNFQGIFEILAINGTITTSPEKAVEYFRLKSDGGVLNSYGVVEFSPGMAPGVFIIVTSDQEDVRELMKFLGFGDGPNYLLYRPYHLTSLIAQDAVQDLLHTKLLKAMR